MNKKEIELWYTEEEKLYAYIYEYDDYKLLEFQFFNSNFSGKGTIFLGENDKENLLKKVDEMILFKSDELIINDSESKYYMKFYYNGNNVYVHGYIGDYSDFSLEFVFKADQTLLKLFKEVLILMFKE